MDYAIRRQINDQSRETADNHHERWTFEEIAFLEENWTTDQEDLKAMAALLNRTVEACRQKHYEIGVAAQHSESTKRTGKRVTAWSQGFTNLDAMGY